VRVQRVEASFLGGGVGVDDPHERLGVRDRQAAPEHHRPGPVPVELQEPGLAGRPEFTFQPVGLVLLGHLGGDHVEQVPRQPPQLPRIV